VTSFPVKTGLGVAGGGPMTAVVPTGLAAAEGGVWISWNRVGGMMAPVCFARKFRMSSFRIRPSRPDPTTSLSLICEDRQTSHREHWTEWGQVGDWGRSGDRRKRLKTDWRY